MTRDPVAEDDTVVRVVDEPGGRGGSPLFPGCRRRRPPGRVEDAARDHRRVAGPLGLSTGSAHTAGRSSSLR